MSTNIYDPNMSLLLAQAVEQAYQYYVHWAKSQPYKIQLPGYSVQSILNVWEIDEHVPIGYTAVRIQPGVPGPNLVIFRGTQTDEESFDDMCWDPTPCVLTQVNCGTAASGVYSFYAGDDGGLVNSLETTSKKRLHQYSPNAHLPSGISRGTVLEAPWRHWPASTLWRADGWPARTIRR